MSVAGFLAETRGDETRPGVNDCALWCASCVLFCDGIDPAADLRGTYSTWFEARQLTMRAGGLLQLAAPRMDAAGLPPREGDGIAVAKAGKLTICGLVVADRLVVRLRDGLRVFDEFTELRSWAPCRKP